LYEGRRFSFRVIAGQPRATQGKTGTIPAKWHMPIIRARSIAGVAIGANDFVTVPDKTAVAVKPPEAKWPGLLDVMGAEIACYVLDDGRRVISRTAALAFLTDGKGGGNIESYLRVEALRPFLPADLADQFIDIIIPQVVNKDVKALSASAFIDICRAYSRGTGH
jgi:hypothetical protein